VTRQREKEKSAYKAITEIPQMKNKQRTMKLSTWLFLIFKIICEE
jgi:hypothetical protein